MKESHITILVVIFGIIAVSSFTSKKSSDNYNVNVSSSVSAADGLDLKAVGALIKKVKDPKDLEKKLNDSSVGINNLDLNEDSKVDYIKVTEYGDETAKGFSLSVDLGPGDTQEVATIQIEKKGDGGDVEVRGNREIYGQGHYYRSPYSGLSTLLIASYLFRPHPFYMSPYGWGRYPGYYRSYRPMSRTAYRSKARNASSGSNFSKKSKSGMSKNITSPNKGKSARNVRAPLKSPTTSQKSFQKRNPSKSVRSGGFGRASRSSVRQSSFGRSSGFSGGGK
ncbi:hypothetical protein MNBD_UNCLBAC01-45 [hydrothermal vent metagenome]|uniref:Uncharacterized protein n=1 Tax=hydrothermal vent metagenome TaxID=652676 RepID=A0A3B1D3P6_9ZZZZ